LGITIDSKFKFTGHIKFITDRCTKLIKSLSMSARIIWRPRHEALDTIWNGAILPQLLYAVSVWIDPIKNEYKTAKYVKVQRREPKQLAPPCDYVQVKQHIRRRRGISVA